MTKRLNQSTSRGRIQTLGAFALAAALSLPAAGADLPKSTQDMLKARKVSCK